jgi:hypothetical protein
MDHPYKRFEDSPAWNATFRAIDELVANQDLQELTHRQYIVGFILQRHDEAGIGISRDSQRPTTNDQQLTP